MKLILHRNLTINFSVSLATSLVLHLGVFAVFFAADFSAPQFGASQSQVFQVEFVAASHSAAAEPGLVTDEREPEVRQEIKKTSEPKAPTKTKPARVAASVENTAQPGSKTENEVDARAAVSASPNYLINPPPRYPESARRAHIEGLVVLLVQVNSEGAATHVELKTSSGSNALDRAAQEAVAKWNFSPARIGGIAVSSQVQVPVRFELRGTEH